VLRPKVLFNKLEGKKRSRYGRTYSVTVLQVYTLRRAVSRTHFYGSGIWVNVPKRRYNTFFHEQCDRRS